MGFSKAYPKENEGEVIPITLWYTTMRGAVCGPFDGTGYYGNGTHYDPNSDVFWEDPEPEVKHVVWFNK